MANPQATPENEYPVHLNIQDQILYQRLKWFIRLRWIAVLGVIVATVVAHDILRVIEQSLPLYLMAGVLALFNFLAFLSLQRRIKTRDFASLRKLAHIQIGGDLVFLTLLLNLSGGIENPFLLFYVFQVVISGILLTPRESFKVSLVAVLLFTGMVFLEQVNLIPHHHLKCYPHGAFIYLPEGGNT